MSCLNECQESLLGYSKLLSGFFTALAIGISAYQVAKHLKNFTNPFFQTKTIMILLMSPFYALTSFLTILTQDYQGYFALFRDIYEAVLIYEFFNLLSSYLAFDQDLRCIDYERIYEMLSTKGIKKHIWPMNHLWKDLILISRLRGRWFFRSCRLYVLQYLAIKPTVTFLLIIVYAFKASIWFYYFFQFIVMISVTLSLYYLVLFYQILHVELAYAKPLLKFLSIKGVLFFTFWQSVAIYMFKRPLLSVFGPIDEHRAELIIAVLECLLVCFEMVVLSVMTTIAFSYKDFKEMQKSGWLLDDQSMMDLGKRLVNNVMSESFITTLEDLKELGDPLQNPFRSFKPGEVKKEANSGSTDTDSSYNNDKDSNAKIYELPTVIPGFHR